jgi:hypothetical protein
MAVHQIRLKLSLLPKRLGLNQMRPTSAATLSSTLPPLGLHTLLSLMLRANLWLSQRRSLCLQNRNL